MLRAARAISLRGSAGVVREPLRARQQNGGVVEMTAGLTRGLLRVPLRPLGGAFDWLSMATADILRATGVELGAVPLERSSAPPPRRNAAHFAALLGAEHGEPWLAEAHSIGAGSELPVTLAFVRATQTLHVVCGERVARVAALDQLRPLPLLTTTPLVTLHVTDEPPLVLRARRRHRSPERAEPPDSDYLTLDELLQRMRAVDQS